jgi:hypothetical protein
MWEEGDLGLEPSFERRPGAFRPRSSSARYALYGDRFVVESRRAISQNRPRLTSAPLYALGHRLGPAPPPFPRQLLATVARLATCPANFLRSVQTYKNASIAAHSLPACSKLTPRPAPAFSLTLSAIGNREDRADARELPRKLSGSSSCS